MPISITAINSQSAPKRVELKVPFSQKDEAKALGARWDASNKVWFVTNTHDLKKFARWLPTEDSCSENLRSAFYFIAQSSQQCWRCGKLTTVYGVVLPNVSECVEFYDDQPEWVSHNVPLVPFHITYLPGQIIRSIQSHAPNYKKAFSKTFGGNYWANHCNSCGVIQGDFNMYSEPEGAFAPFNQTQAEKIMLHHVNAPFTADAAGYQIDPEFFSLYKLS